MAAETGQARGQEDTQQHTLLHVPLQQRMWQYRHTVSGSMQRGAPRVQGEDVTSAACGRISCVPT